MASFSPAHQAQTIIVHGFAKAWSMTGCAAAAPRAHRQGHRRGAEPQHQQSDEFRAEGCGGALTGSQEHLPRWLAEYAQRRTYAWQKLNSIPGISCVNSKGAFYLFPNIRGTGLKSAEFCSRLLESEKVAAVPGIAFGADDYLRISYATGLANIEKGLDRLDRFVRGLKK